MLRFFLIFTLVFSFSCHCIFAQENDQKQKEFQDFEELSLEDLLNVEVVTVSKKSEKLSEAPAAVYVITDEDIRQSGATNIPDVLRVVPGLDVIQITASESEINPRGFCGPNADKILILIDDRTVYFDFFGGTNWESLPINLEEIKRIEVIRGPGSALWGANAFNGVINIITKPPEEIDGLVISGVGGETSFSSSSFIYANTHDRIGYKISFGWKGLDEFEDRFTLNSDKRSQRALRGNSHFEYKINKNSKIESELGLWDGRIETYAGITPTKTIADATINYLKVDYEYGDIYLKAFRNMGDITLSQFLPEGDVQIKFSTYDFEFRHNFSLNQKNSIVWGCSYRLSNEKSSQQNRLFERNLFAAFFQEEFKAKEFLKIFIGARVDDHPLARQNFSPKGTILFSPKENHNLRIQVGTAFKCPTIIDSEVNLLVNRTQLPSPPLPYPASTEIFWKGNSDLYAEKIITYELGYWGLFKKFTLGADFFFNEMDDLIKSDSLEIAEILVDLSTGQPILDPQTGNPIPTKINISATNHGKVEAKGGELWLNYKITKGLAGLFNYSYQELIDKNTNRKIKSSPSHKANFGIRFKHKSGFSTNWLVHYVSQTEWPISELPNSSSDEYVKVDPYTIVNLRLGYSIFQGRGEIFVSAFNAFDNKHLEYYCGEEIGRRVSVGLTIKL